MRRQIFVFGSNLLGIHGAGAAKYAKEKCGAVSGIGYGLQGDSYAIPTKLSPKERLNLKVIKVFVDEFKKFAGEHPEMEFLVTPIGTGLAGYSHEEIAPMFIFSPSNCVLPEEWVKYYLS